MRIVLDIEANGLNPTDVWCVVTRDIDNDEVRLFYGEALQKEFPVWISGADQIIGHNCLEYDIPVLRRLLGCTIPDEIIYDTLVVGRVLDSGRADGHSLESYGQLLKHPKTEHSDWSKFSPEMLEYCKNDVELNLKLYRYFDRIISRNREAFRKAIECEHRIQCMCLEMSRNGFVFDIHGLEELDASLAASISELDEKIKGSFPDKVEIIQLKTKTKKENYKSLICLTGKNSLGLSTLGITTTERRADGTKHREQIVLKDFTELLWKTMSECYPNKMADAEFVDAFQQGKNLLSIIVIGQEEYVDCSAMDAILNSVGMKFIKLPLPITYCKVKRTPFNPRSVRQIVERLHEAGWKPYERTKTYITKKRNREKISETLDTYGWKVNEANLSTLPEDAPEGCKYLIEHILLSARRRTLAEWRAAFVNSTGRIHGRYNPLGTVTQRCSHSNPNMGNIATKKTIKYNSQRLRTLATDLGGRMRSFWLAPEGGWLVGTDMESAHLRIFAHLIDDKEFTQSLISGKKEDGTDPHSVNKRRLGILCPDRDRAKTFIFSFLNGAGASKVAEIFGCSLPEATEVLDAYVKAYPGLEKLKQEVIPRDAQRGYFVGIDGRLVKADSEHKMIGMYLQNMESVLMKYAWIDWYDNLIRQGIDFRPVNWVHDEWVTETGSSKEVACFIGQTQSDSIRRIGEDFKLRCPMGGEYKVGKNWLEVH